MDKKEIMNDREEKLEGKKKSLNYKWQVRQKNPHQNQSPESALSFE